MTGFEPATSSSRTLSVGSAGGGLPCRTVHSRLEHCSRSRPSEICGLAEGSRLGPFSAQITGHCLGVARESQRPDSGAKELGGVAGSRVAGGHHAVTRSALEAVRSLADAQAKGRWLGGLVIGGRSPPVNGVARPVSRGPCTWAAPRVGDLLIRSSARASPGGATGGSAGVELNLGTFGHSRGSQRVAVPVAVPPVAIHFDRRLPCPNSEGRVWTEGTVHRRPLHPGRDRSRCRSERCPPGTAIHTDGCFCPVAWRPCPG